LSTLIRIRPERPIVSACSLRIFVRLRPLWSAVIQERSVEYDVNRHHDFVKRE
jgi:hypothetical protein